MRRQTHWKLSCEYVNLCGFPGSNRCLSTHGVVYNKDKEKGNECYIDASFAGGWDQVDANNVEESVSHSGCVITYMGWPFLWWIKLYTGFALTNMEEEYLASSEVMHGVIPFMFLMKEISFIFNIHLPLPDIYWKVFEDNQSYISVRQSNNFSLRTKHIAIKYQH